ncbi:hypothetical protein [Methylobrevis pamukkalensis]|uniref:Uncharacterized protein n=1 Tax=Methylobrevis pamukkalensis TaxID=1439726 RepID=A0A1E3H239_9HYPH|nr:hypothetical protein [Methylobrevis pamukkalensis]ODN70205.1 hypothetical protein A6302_02479 [Methylobrevis pamukkalensis]
MWWARWWWLSRLGAKDAAGNRHRGPQIAAAMVDSARRNLAVGETETEAARLEAVAVGFVYVLVGSNEFGAWKAHWRHRGIDLPKPDHADRIFMPSLWPPDEGGEVMEFAGLEG